MWGEARARERRGAWGKGRKEKTEGNRHPPGGGQKPFTPGETGRGREREREYSGDRSREGRKEGRSLERDVPKETEASW